MERPSTFFSRSFIFRIPVYFRRRLNLSHSQSAPASRWLSPRDTPSTSTASPTEGHCPLTNGTGIELPAKKKKDFLSPEEVRLIFCTLTRALKEVDFGNEIVVRLLNDKRSLFKSLLARCGREAHDIEVFDVQTLARFCPRAVRVGDGVTRFFENVAIVLGTKNLGAEELEERICEMCRANGQMHYRMKVWFQAENWLCVKHSVVDTILMANSDVKRGNRVKSMGDVNGLRSTFPQRSRIESMLSRIESMNGRTGQSVEVVWMKLMQAVIMWMKQGFLEAALNGREEQDEEL